MTPAELDVLIAAPSENETLEFKEAKQQYSTEKLRKYCVAPANEGGGKLVLGVTDGSPRRVVGSSAFLNLVDIRGKLLSWLGFRVDAEEIQHPDGRVVVFVVPSRPPGRPYAHEGAYLMRAGESLVPMTPDHLAAIFAEGQAHFVERVARRDVSSDEVVRLLDTQIYFDRLKLPYPATREAVLDRFEREGLVRRLGDSGQFDITNLGALLFAKDLSDFGLLHRRAPRVIEYAGAGKTATKSDHPSTKGFVVGFDGVIDSSTRSSPRTR